MKKGQYKNYRECIICHKILPLTREYFMRYGNCPNYHNACRECENQLKVDGEWKDGKLLCHKCLHYKPESEFYKEGKTAFELECPNGESIIFDLIVKRNTYDIKKRE